jgi:hypothetical protein
MFTIDTVVDAYVNQTKAVLTHVQPDAVRDAMLSLVDAQAAFARGLAKQVETASAYFTETAKTNLKTDWTKLIVANK